MVSYSTIIQARPGLLNALVDTLDPDRSEDMLEGIKGPWIQKPTKADFSLKDDPFLPGFGRMLLLAVEIEYSKEEI